MVKQLICCFSATFDRTITVSRSHCLMWPEMVLCSGQKLLQWFLCYFQQSAKGVFSFIITTLALSIWAVRVMMLSSRYMRKFMFSSFIWSQMKALCLSPTLSPPMSYSPLSLSFTLQSSATEKAARFCCHCCENRADVWERRRCWSSAWLRDVESVSAEGSKEAEYLGLFCSILSLRHGSLEWEGHRNHPGTFQHTVGDARRLVTLDF